MQEIKFSIYRYNPETDKKPTMQPYTLKVDGEGDIMLLDALIRIKEQTNLNFRYSCGEGVCGSDGLNVNGKNVLSCMTSVSSLKQPIAVRPLPGMPVIRDLVVDLSQFYKQYEKIGPYLKTKKPPVATENRQSPEERAMLDGLYECILCACCTTSCPSFWWNPDKFLGPAALLQAARFVKDTRDEAKEERLKQIEDAHGLYDCHGIMNCVDVCPKGLNPTKAISDVRTEILKSGG